MIAGMEGFNPAVALAMALATLLLILACLRPMALRWSRNCAIAGAALLTGLAVYGHDVMNMPEICGAMVIGGAIGLLLAREWPARRLAGLLGGSAGLAGLASVATALAAFRNPHAFGLLGEAGDRIPPTAATLIAFAVILGAMAGGGGAVMLTVAEGSRPRWKAATLALALILALLPAFAMQPQPPLIGALMGLGFVTGMLLIPGAGGVVAPLAMLGGMAGWSIAALAFLLHNMGLGVAGGLAGSGGTVLALRLLRPSARNGLADTAGRP